jgi:ubiquinone biosynthesis monooxygenase Coq7
LAAVDRQLSARLMRVNHAGEIAAQALYRGQALVTRDPALRNELLGAARDEHDHLAWCRERVGALGESVSVLSPFWYAGALAIGVAAGLAGDRVSMGFLVATERQVSDHLGGHLGRLPPADTESHAIVAQMRDDEERHGHAALARGAAELPLPVRAAMRLAAGVMTTVAFWL